MQYYCASREWQCCAFDGWGSIRPSTWKFRCRQGRTIKDMPCFAWKGSSGYSWNHSSYGHICQNCEKPNHKWTIVRHRPKRSRCCRKDAWSPEPLSSKHSFGNSDLGGRKQARAVANPVWDGVPLLIFCFWFCGIWLLVFVVGGLVLHSILQY